MEAGLMRRLFVGALLIAGLAGCASTSAERAPELKRATEVKREAADSSSPAGFVDVKALVIVRHADIDVAKKAVMGGAVPLTERGEARAKELAYALKDFGITRIVTSEAVRTKETAAALAKELGIEMEVASGHGKEVG